MAQVYKSGISLTFTVAIVTKMTAKIGWKIGNWPFWSEYETVDREINMEHKQMPKRYFNRWRELSWHTTYLKDFFVFSCADI